jgi:hypothetical protein
MNIRSTLMLAAALGFALIPARAYCVEEAAAQAAKDDGTFTSKEVLKAISDLGGDVSADMAKVLESVFAQNGRPTAVIVGKEAQGAFIIGYRKGSGKLLAKGQAPAQAQELAWHAPSIGFNVGASASRVTILVYGARSSDQLMDRFTSIQGSYHFIAGAAVSYLRSNLDMSDKTAISLAHVSVGVGLDAGVALESLTFHK